ncbi:MAG: hypothetical protein RMJ35_10760 [Phycisphaerales bacterium]|nr:hypothetical protein [Phycisphaerales bacterium]
MRARAAMLLFLIMSLAGPARGVILFSSAERNTAAPTGTLSGSGWQYQAQFTGFLGTPISPRYFITAQHIGGFVGQDVIYQGQTYFTDQFIDVPGTDLRLWRISGTFPSWAPLYDRASDGSEVGKRLVVFGRGTQRGEPILLDEPIRQPSNGPSRLHQPIESPFHTAVKGWRWGPDDRLQSWGENTVSDVISDPGFGELLYFTFDRGAGPNEAHLSAGDSGGGVFIESAGVWKLAGINFAVDGPFRLAPTEPEFLGAIFDAGGLYVGNPPTLLPNTSEDLPTGAYASAISGSLPFILQTISAGRAVGIPEPRGATLLLAAAAALSQARRLQWNRHTRSGDCPPGCTKKPLEA